MLDLLAGLDAAGCHPVILRNHTRFPAEIGNDVDVWVRPQTHGLAMAIFRQVSADHGFVLAHLHRRFSFSAHWVAHPDDPTRLLHIDLYPYALRWHGHPFLDEAGFASEARWNGPFRIPHPAHEAWSLAATSLLWGGFFKERYREEIARLARQNEGEFQRIVDGYLGGQSRVLHERIDGLADAAVDRLLTRRLRRSVRRRHLSSAPRAAIVGCIMHWSWEIRCYLIRPPGTAILVPDSDVARELCTHYGAGPHAYGAVSVQMPPPGAAAAFAAILRRRYWKAKNHLVIVANSDSWSNWVDIDNRVDRQTWERLTTEDLRNLSSDHVRWSHKGGA